MADLQLHNACDIWEPRCSLSSLPDSYCWAAVLRSASTLNAQLHIVKTLVDGEEKKEKKLFRDYLRVPGLRGAVFTGPVGNGRHTTAEALACTLGKLNKEMLQVRIYGADLDYESPDVALDAMASVGYALKNAKGLILLLDEPQDCRHSRLLQTKLLRMMERSKQTLYVIIVTDRIERILPGLRQRLMLCHCPKPTEEQRREWLADQLRNPYHVLPEEMSAAEAARETKGFSWHQLQMLVASLRYRLYWNARRKAEEIGAQEASKFILEEDQKQARQKASGIGKIKSLMEKRDQRPEQLDFEEILRAIREQELPDAPAVMSVPVFQGQQMVMQSAVPQNQTASGPAAEEAPATAEAAMDELLGNGKDKPSKENLLEKMALHENIDDFASLTGNLGLSLPSAEALDAAMAGEEGA